MKRNNESAVLAVMALLLFTLPVISHASGLDNYYKSIQDFLNSNFPEQGYLPTAYGADARYAPKRVWIKVSNSSPSGGWRRKPQTWVVLSSGVSLYPDDLVPIFSEEIVTSEWVLGRSEQIALAAALSGQVEKLNASADLDILLSDGLSAHIKWGDVRVEYGHYYDFLLAQNVNNRAFELMKTTLANRFESIPPTRVIISSIAVKDAEVRIEISDSNKLSLSGTLGTVLKKLGFTWTKDTDLVATLSTEGRGWKYLAYQALYTDGDIKISKEASNTHPPADDVGNDSAREDNFPWLPPEAD